MVLTEKLAQLIDILLSSDEPITSLQFSEKLGVSQRSIFTYLKEVKYIFDKSNVELVNRPGVGIYVDANIETKTKIKNSIKIDIDYSLSYKARRDYIIGILARNNESYTIQHLADDLFVSKSVIVKDLNDIEDWLKKYNIELIRKKNFGLAIKGEELDIRRAVLYLRGQQPVKKAKDSMRRPKELDYRIRLSFWNRIQETYPGLDLKWLQSVLTRIDLILKKSMTVESFTYVMEFNALMITRMKMGFSLSQVTFPIDELEDTKEYVAAKSILKEIADHFHITINEYEILYFTACLRCMDYQYSEEETEAIYHEIEQKYVDMAESLIRLVCDMININLKGDATLKKQLAIFLFRTVLRKKYKIEVKSIIHQEIKNTFSGILGICFSATSVLENLDEQELNESDVANIAMFFCNSLFRSKRGFPLSLLRQSIKALRIISPIK